MGVTPVDCVWHEAHPGVLDVPLRPCFHAVLRSDGERLWVQRDCRRHPDPSHPVVELRLSDLAAGHGTEAHVTDRHAFGPFDAAAWFFTLPVPPEPERVRPEGWRKLRDDVKKAARAKEKADRVRWEAYSREADAERVRQQNAQHAPGGARAAKLEELTRCLEHLEALVVLGLPATRMPTSDELRDAWRRAAKRHHPDAGGKQSDFIAAKAARERLEKAMHQGGGRG